MIDQHVFRPICELTPHPPPPQFQVLKDPVGVEGGMINTCFTSFVNAWWPLRREPNVLMLHFSDMKRDHEGSGGRFFFPFFFNSLFFNATTRNLMSVFGCGMLHTRTHAHTHTINTYKHTHSAGASPSSLTLKINMERDVQTRPIQITFQMSRPYSHSDVTSLFFFRRHVPILFQTSRPYSLSDGTSLFSLRCHVPTLFHSAYLF